LRLLRNSAALFSIVNPDFITNFAVPNLSSLLTSSSQPTPLDVLGQSLATAIPRSAAGHRHVVPAATRSMMPTGGGKSRCATRFRPSCGAGHGVTSSSPLIALMHDQVGALTEPV
jgi:hypothetical protein